MIQLCTDPTCDDDAGVTLQRQIDPAPVPFCLRHGAARENELKLALVNYQRVVIVALEPSELERTQRRLEELEAHSDTEKQLETAINTLEKQGEALRTCRDELAESRQAFDVAQRELDRVKRERDRIQGDLTMATRALELARTGNAPAPLNVPAAPATPPPPTRPDGSKP